MSDESISRSMSFHNMDSHCIETSPVHKHSHHNGKFNFDLDGNQVLLPLTDHNIEQVLREHDLKCEQNTLPPKSQSSVPLTIDRAEAKRPSKLDRAIVDFLNNPTPTRHKNSLHSQNSLSNPEREHNSVKEPDRTLHIPAFNPEKSAEKRNSKQARGPVENVARRYHLEPTFKSKSQSLIGVHSLQSLGQRSFESELRLANRDACASESEYSDKLSGQKMYSPGSESDNSQPNSSPQMEGQEPSRSDDGKRLSLCDTRMVRGDGSHSYFKKNPPVAKRGFNISNDFFSKKKSHVYGVVANAKKRADGTQGDSDGPSRYFKKKDLDSGRDRQSPDIKSEMRNSGGKTRATKA